MRTFGILLRAKYTRPTPADFLVLQARQVFTLIVPPFISRFPESATLDTPPQERPPTFQDDRLKVGLSGPRNASSKDFARTAMHGNTELLFQVPNVDYTRAQFANWFVWNHEFPGIASCSAKPNESRVTSKNWRGYANIFGEREPYQC